MFWVLIIAMLCSQEGLSGSPTFCYNCEGLFAANCTTEKCLGLGIGLQACFVRITDNATVERGCMCMCRSTGPEAEDSSFRRCVICYESKCNKGVRGYENVTGSSGKSPFFPRNAVFFVGAYLLWFRPK